MFSLFIKPHTFSLFIKYSLDPFNAACIGLGVRPFTEACLNPEENWLSLSQQTFIASGSSDRGGLHGIWLAGSCRGLGTTHSCLQWSCHIWRILFPTDVALTILHSLFREAWQEEVWYRCPRRAEHCTVPYPLHRNWLWVSVLIGIYSEKKMPLQAL